MCPHNVSRPKRSHAPREGPLHKTGHWYTSPLQTITHGYFPCKATIILSMPMYKHGMGVGVYACNMCVHPPDQVGIPPCLH